jgi:hypothetical protein
MSSTSDTIVSTLDGAIKEAREFVHLEALANELAGFACARKRCTYSSKSLLGESHLSYKYGWGAIAKADWLQEKSNQIMGRMKAGRREEDLYSSSL